MSFCESGNTFSIICPQQDIPQTLLKWMFQLLGLVSPGFGGVMPAATHSIAYSNV